MSGNTEPSSNPMKFAPMPLSALLAELMPKKPSESSDSSYTSADESDNSFGETVAKKSFSKAQSKNVPTSTPIVSNANAMKGFISEKKVIPYESNKENQSKSNQSLSTNWIYPINERAKSGKGSHLPQSVNKHVFSKPTSPEMKSCRVMTPLSVHGQKNEERLDKKTPDQLKPTNSTHKTKAATPKFSHQKSGIRRFTPGSGRHSHRKTPQKIALQQTNKESVRCLFPDNQITEEASCPSTLSQPVTDTNLNRKPQPVPDTPLNRNPQPASYAATPSYPQGVVGNQSKILLKTTTIKGKKYINIKKLGTGGSSEVYKVLEVGTSCEYAVKCVNLSVDSELVSGYINEVKLLRRLQNSDRVIKLYDYEYDRENKLLRVILEVGETDLSSLLKAHGAVLNPGLLLYYWEEMLHAVNHIHNHGVIHADLKPANFLMVCGRLKLIDFGIASSISSDATSVVRPQATGTYSYISPEALMGGAGGYGNAGREGNEPIKISYRSDVWSLGCILYSMVYGRTPFSHIPSLAKLAAILDPNHRIDYPPVEHRPRLISALKWCLTYNVRARPSVKELLSIPYCSCGGYNPDTNDETYPLVTRDKLGTSANLKR